MLNPDEHMSVTSPWHPRQYPTTQDCTWRITTSVYGSIIVNFLDLNTGPGHDKLYVGRKNATVTFNSDATWEGPDQLLFTGHYFPAAVRVPENEIVIYWDSSIWTAGGRGFSMVLEWASSNGKDHVYTDFAFIFKIYSYS